MDGVCSGGAAHECHIGIPRWGHSALGAHLISSPSPREHSVWEGKGSGGSAHVAGSIFL